MSNSKRKGREEEADATMAEANGAKKGTGAKALPTSQGLRYEDNFEDDVEDEVVVDSGNNMEVEGDSAAAQETNANRQLFRAGIDKLGENEQLDYDNSAYAMLHRMRCEWPCLSFDFVQDSLGANRTRYPMTSFMVAGTQSADPRENKILLYEMTDMYRTKKDREDDREISDDEESDDDNLDDDPIVRHRSIKHTGAVNRIRSMPQQPGIVATWSDTGRVYLWDLETQLNGIGFRGKATQQQIQSAAAESLGQGFQPIFSYKGHRDEGYALDWSSVDTGRLATGDCYREIRTFKVGQDGKVVVDGSPLLGHKASVEDIQWSPTETTVLSSCSCDGTVKIWDTRNRNSAMLSINAHDTDVNVISWNRSVAYLLASGADDGEFKVWDLRMIKPKKESDPVGHFTWHKKPVTSLEWHPTDESVIAVSGDDNQVSVWDLALEEDIEVGNQHPKLTNDVFGSSGQKVDIPPQLLFLHQGQDQPKEIHFHPQIPGLIGSTAADGIHMFICEPLDPKTNLLKT